MEHCILIAGFELFVVIDKIFFFSLHFISKQIVTIQNVTSNLVENIRQNHPGLTTV